MGAAFSGARRTADAMVRAGACAAAIAVGPTGASAHTRGPLLAIDIRECVVSELWFFSRECERLGHEGECGLKVSEMSGSPSGGARVQSGEQRAVF
jgi:hypothetical protein